MDLSWPVVELGNRRQFYICCYKKRLFEHIWIKQENFLRTSIPSNIPILLLFFVSLDLGAALALLLCITQMALILVPLTYIYGHSMGIDKITLSRTYYRSPHHWNDIIHSTSAVLQWIYTNTNTHTDRKIGNTLNFKIPTWWQVDWQ